jgi:hypothetical protein
LSFFFHICLLRVNQFCFVTILLLCTSRYLLFIVFTDGIKKGKKWWWWWWCWRFLSFFPQISSVLSYSYVSTWVCFSLLSRSFACFLSSFTETKDEQARCYQPALSIQHRTKLIDTRQYAPAHIYSRSCTINIKRKKSFSSFFGLWMIVRKEN